MWKEAGSQSKITPEDAKKVKIISDTGILVTTVYSTSITAVVVAGIPSDIFVLSYSLFLSCFTCFEDLKEIYVCH